MTRTIEVAARDAMQCARCDLSKTRTQVVYASGDPAAELMFIGEAPGFHEDRKGTPFVGAAGNLLNDLIQGIGLSRDDVYVANVLKCRPPGNRDPLPGEIDACTPWLSEQVKLVDPLVLCSLGNFATKFLLRTQIGISRMRGQRYELEGRVLVPTFHPAAILHSGRSGTAMGQMEDDFRLIAKVLEEVRASQPAASAPGADPGTQSALF